jgi:hypothetical protein
MVVSISTLRHHFEHPENVRHMPVDVYIDSIFSYDSVSFSYN